MLDPSRSISIGGFTVPALVSRQSETTVRLSDGQSFAIAGLLSNRTRSQIDKVPLLGDIPILGACWAAKGATRRRNPVSVKMTIPLVLCILPSLTAVVMGPAVVSIIEAFFNSR